MKNFCNIVATVGRVGYFPVAPGTVSSIFALATLFLFPSMSVYIQIYSAVILITIAIISADFMVKESGFSDPSFIVIDEFAGMWVAMIGIPRLFIPALISFFLFRLFDIWKPFPIRSSQDLKGGCGVVVDDVLAGVYAMVLNYVILRIIY
jgi:phosphatidylglycerophosphatase A